MIARIPLEDAPGAMKVGSRVELSNGISALVIEVTDEFVTVDANHVLAGQVRIKSASSALLPLKPPPSHVALLLFDGRMHRFG